MTRPSIQHIRAAPLPVPLQYVSHIRVQREVLVIIPSKRLILALILWRRDPLLEQK